MSAYPRQARRSPTLADAMTCGRRNNFDLVRLAAAMAVMVSHAWPLALGPGAREPLESVAAVSLGGLAVFAFFFLSGFLVTGSACRADSNPARFCLARAARILPGLAGCLLVTACAFHFGAAAGQISVEDAFGYVVRGLGVVSPIYEVPGLFDGNPYPLVANGPLWTLFYEVACYAILASAAFTGLLSRPLVWLAAGAVLAAIFVWSVAGDTPAGGAAYRLATGAPLAVAFFFGALSCRLAARIRLDWRFGLAVAIAAIACAGSDFASPLLILALGYLSLLVAYRLPPIALPGDVSYGVYIYGWPVAQMLVALGLPRDPSLLAVASVAAVLPVALASWALIERPALRAARRRPLRRPAGEVAA